MSEKVIPKKALGQHWLHDELTLESICDDAGVQAGDTVLEIGPGLGTLTNVLLQRGAHVIAIEYDKELATTLVKRLQNAGVDTEHLAVYNEDILRFDFSQLAEGYKVVANIPYYLTSHLVRRLSESTTPFSAAALLMQKEVAERACANPGDMSLLSVTTQYYNEVKLGTYAPAELFTPPPKVDSQVLVLEYRTQPLFDGTDTKTLFRLVKAGFSQKRKNLVNSLSGGLSVPKDEVRLMLAKAGIPENTRAQALSLEQWHKLYAQLKV